MPFFDPRRPSYQADPYPALARLRAEAPVFRAPNLNAWVVTRYEDCSQVLHDADRFTPHPELTAGLHAEAIRAHRSAVPLGEVGSLGTTSGAEHRRLRGIVNPLFAPAAVHSYQAEIAAACNELVGALPRAVPFDFMEALADPLPKRIILGRLGLPAQHANSVAILLQGVEQLRFNPRADPSVITAATEAAQALRPPLSPEAEALPPEGTVLAALHEAARAGVITLDEVVSVLAHIATVGSDPTAGGLGNAIATLATHPEASAQLRADSSKLRSAVHELLRFDSPTHIVARFAVDNFEFGSRRMRRGDAVFAVVGAANRDPAEFEQPDTFDITRDARRQLAFGQGEHICLGAPLAVAIMETALAAILRRFEHIELVAPPDYSQTVELRIPDRLVVRLE